MFWFAAVDRNNNVRSEHYREWYVSVCEKNQTGPMEVVFRDKSKKKCVEYAKQIAENVHVGNGVEYGAKW